MKLCDILDKLTSLVDGECFIDFGNGFRFIIDDVQFRHNELYGDSIDFKAHPKSLTWVEIEYQLNPKNFMKGYDQFLAECYEAEDEFWDNYFEDIEADEVIMFQKENF